jgi:hypothetical protein
MQKHEIETAERRKLNDDVSNSPPAPGYQPVLLKDETVNLLKQVAADSFDAAIVQLIRYAKGQRRKQGLIITDMTDLRARKFVPPPDD